RPGALTPPPPLPDVPNMVGDVELPLRPRTGAVPLPVAPPPPAPPPRARQATQPLQAPQIARAPTGPRAVPVPLPPVKPARPATAAHAAPEAAAPPVAAPPAAEPAPAPAKAPPARLKSVPLTPEERAAFGVPPVTGPVPATIEEAEKTLAAADDREQVGRIV